jgi:DNA-binding SARP family transcriptional activator
VTVEFRVLGQIEALVNGEALDVGHARQQSVLAALLVEANRVVSVDQLVERTWEMAPTPRDPRRALRTYVWRLRRVLAAVGDVALVRHAPGYKLVVEEEQVDLHRFRALLAWAETAGDDDRAAALIEQAMGLWRGEPFAGLDAPWIESTRHSLLLHRLTARLDLTDIHLRQGRHAALLTGLTDHAAEHPLDERIAGQLILALYRSGRTADALAAYHRIRAQLADELGVDPGPALQQLQLQILTADSALATDGPSPGTAPAVDSPDPDPGFGADPDFGPGADPVPDPATERGPAVFPRQLPAPPRLFIGRTTTLARMSAALDEQIGSGGTLVISALGGMGKTWLALNWAHRNLDRFPDGQLYVDLRGFAPSGRPMPTQTAVCGLLDALGVPPAGIPADPDAQVGKYRSLVAGKRMLIVLDNARDTAQVSPLLPACAACTVLVTSRHRLTGLITGHSAVPVELDVLSNDEAHGLLARYLGRDRVTAEPDALAALLEYCAGLPLALSVVAARALAQPGLPLTALADELEDVSARLDALATGDLSANVPAALRWSFDALNPESASALALLALAPGPDIGLSSAASLLARPITAARTLLRDLENAFLLQQRTLGRYRMHDLVRLYATARAEKEQTPVRQEAAHRRVLGPSPYLVHAAQSAARLPFPRRVIEFGPPPPAPARSPLP